jgi:hypothetical protein
MTNARKQQVARILGGEPPTAVVDMTTLRSAQLEREEMAKRDAKQRELLRLALMRGLMALGATTRAMFLHHFRAAERHMRDMGVD